MWGHLRKQDHQYLAVPNCNGSDGHEAHAHKHCFRVFPSPKAWGYARLSEHPQRTQLLPR